MEGLEGGRAGLLSPLPPPAWHYGDYVRWQADMLAGPRGEQLAAYWRQQLAGDLPLLELPTDHPRPALQTFTGSAHTFKLDEVLTRRLNALAQAEGVTLYMVLLAAFQVLLHRYTGQEDVIVGSPLSGRTSVILSAAAMTRFRWPTAATTARQRPQPTAETTPIFSHRGPAPAPIALTDTTPQKAAA